LVSRRRFFIALGANAFSVPFASFAQQKGKVWRVGFLSQRTRPASLDSDFYGGFPRGMRELGYVEGENVIFEWRFAGGNSGNLGELAMELARLKVDVIVTAGTPATVAAQKATAIIPIVMGTVADPVGSGLVASLARPGGNITGLSNLARDLRPKHLEMLRGVLPTLSTVGVLINDQTTVPALRAATQTMNVKILPLEARTSREIQGAFATMVREGAGAVIVSLDPFFVQQGRQIADQAVAHRLASISPNREFPEAGGLISYGQNQAENYRRAATYVDKIFKGAKTADLPVEQPTKFELIINGKTAKTLGLKIPQSLLTLADKVIE